VRFWTGGALFQYGRAVGGTAGGRTGDGTVGNVSTEQTNNPQHLTLRADVGFTD